MAMQNINTQNIVYSDIIRVSSTENGMVARKHYSLATSSKDNGQLMCRILFKDGHHAFQIKEDDLERVGHSLFMKQHPSGHWYRMENASLINHYETRDTPSGEVIVTIHVANQSMKLPPLSKEGFFEVFTRATNVYPWSDVPYVQPETMSSKRHSNGNARLPRHLLRRP